MDRAPSAPMRQRQVNDRAPSAVRTVKTKPPSVLDTAVQRPRTIATVGGTSETSQRSKA